jgi:hypothetical protein
VLLKILEDDARFFKSVGLIDYSLLLFKVNWKKLGAESVSSKLKKINNPFFMVESEVEEGVRILACSLGVLPYWDY